MFNHLIKEPWCKYVVTGNHTQALIRFMRNCLDAMRLLGLVRLSLQTLALAIFAYQLAEALQRYMSFSSIASVETTDIAAVQLPDIFVCLKAQNVSAVEMVNTENHANLAC